MTSPTTKLRPAAQYIRMSTDGQQYSLEHQQAVISAYAQSAGFEIVQTYTDAGRSGVTARRRDGLSALLADVVSKQAPYTTLLVLDVSRWGRYQDPDEAAHYEFLCRSSGVEVRYCAETFEPGLAGSVFKALKRVMAGEYSRELSTKVRVSKHRNALAGNAPGGTARYGFARQIVNPDGSLGRVLERGERKQRPEQTLQFIPEGPKQSAVLRQIFRLYLNDHLRMTDIARRLNAERKPWLDGTPWNKKRISEVLRCELVTGRQPFGKTAVFLGDIVYHDRATWGSVQVFPPIVPVKTYERVQARLASLHGRSGKTDEEMLEDLRILKGRYGRVTAAMIDADPRCGASATYCSRFGTLSKAYKLAGFHYAPRERGRREDGSRISREEVLDRIRDLHAEKGKINRFLCRDDERLPALDWIRWEFGSLNEAFDAAGVPHRSNGGPRRKSPNSVPPQAPPGKGRAEVFIGPYGGRYMISSGGRKKYGC